MGEVASILALASSRSVGMTDNDILAVINPPQSQRDRSTMALADGYTMPSHAEWRMVPTLGAKLDERFPVRANHFLLDTTLIPSRIFLYHVHIKKVETNGIVNTEDIASTEDARMTVSLLSRLRDRHPEWKGIAKLDFAYDTRSALYTTAQLPLTGNKISEIIGVRDANGKYQPTHFTFFRSHQLFRC